MRTHISKPEAKCRQLLLEKCDAIETTLKYTVTPKEARSYYNYLIGSRSSFFVNNSQMEQINSLIPNGKNADNFQENGVKSNY